MSASAKATVVDEESPVEAVRRALAASLVTGTLTDTAYHLFSRRLANGHIGLPRTIYANSTVLQASGDHFVARGCLSDANFHEARWA